MTAPRALLTGSPVIAGAAAGPLLVSSEPLSFWGGYDQTTGEIIDRRHPLSGRNAAGCVLAVPFSRGSSTTTAVLLESVRRHKNPAAILTTSADSFFALASIVADEMYGRSIPVVALSAEEFQRLELGMAAVVHVDGTVEVHASTESLMLRGGRPHSSSGNGEEAMS